MRDNKKRYKAETEYQIEKEIMRPMLGGPDHLDKSQYPENIFTDCGVSCPSCGCKKVFESGGYSMSGSEISTYLCYDCKKEFDIYHDV